MTDRPRFMPSMLNQSWLKAIVLEQYPSHQQCKEWIDLLVVEYIKLWRLVLSYPEKRVVAPGCIVAVQQVHQFADREAYFQNCMQYFNRYIPSEDFAWQGYRDTRGVIDTLNAYADLYHDSPPLPWIDITQTAEIRKSVLRIV